MTMDALPVIAPLIGVILGSGLTALGAYLRERKERKRTIAVALAELLEIRHRLVAADIIFTQIRTRVEVPEEVMPALRNLFDSLVLLNDGADERYNNAVSLLAGIDPLLAFSLRSKNILPRVLASLRTLAIGSGANLKEFESVESTLRLAVVPNLNKAALDLACHHSWLTKRRIQKHIAQCGELPPEVSQLLDQLKSLPSYVPPPEGKGHG